MCAVLCSPARCRVLSRSWKPRYPWARDQVLLGSASPMALPGSVPCCLSGCFPCEVEHGPGPQGCGEVRPAEAHGGSSTLKGGQQRGWWEQETGWWP